MIKIKAKPISYSDSKRAYSSISYIVIHNTGNKGDKAESNGRYFATANTRQAGAHFFVDGKGTICKSIDINRSAWAVGGAKYPNCSKTGGGKYYGKCSNYNSVSIELCDIVDKYPTKKQIEATKKLIKKIKKTCPNIKHIIRHFDVNGKPCPAYFVDNKKWEKLVKEVWT